MKAILVFNIIVSFSLIIFLNYQIVSNETIIVLFGSPIFLINSLLLIKTIKNEKNRKK